MADYSIDTFQDYIEGLCVAHTEVRHNIDGQRSFARFMSEEDTQALSTNAGPNVVALMRFYGRAVGAADEQRIKQYVLLRFVCKAAGYTTEAINEAIDKAWHIMWDFVARFRQDVRSQECHALEGIELQNLSWDEVPGQPVLEAHYGWDLTIPFNSYQPVHDPARWTGVVLSEEQYPLSDEADQLLIPEA